MSQDEEDYEQINVKVPKTTKELAKKELEYGGLTRVIRDTLTQIAHGEEVSEYEKVKDQLQNLRDQKRSKIQQRNQLDSDIEDLDVKIERAEDRLNELEDKVGEYEGALRMIEQSMREEEQRVFVGHGKIKRVAELGNCSQEDVISDLRERNPELPNYMFEEGVERRI